MRHKGAIIASISNIFSFDEACKFCSSVTKSSDERGPRPALFQGIVGKRHKKAIKMQEEAGHEKATASSKKWTGLNLATSVTSIFSKINNLGVIARTGLLIFCTLCMVVLCCYPSAKTFYIQERKTERLLAEQTAVNERNEQVQKNVDALNTDEGIEASAHEELGYVKTGEGSAIVIGVDTESRSKMIQYVDPKSITAPNTWYNSILDVVFGYDNSSKSSSSS